MNKKELENFLAVVSRWFAKVNLNKERRRHLMEEMKSRTIELENTLDQRERNRIGTEISRIQEEILILDIAEECNRSPPPWD